MAHLTKEERDAMRDDLDGRIAQEDLKLLTAMHEGLPGYELLKIEENLRNLRKLRKEMEKEP